METNDSKNSIKGLFIIGTVFFITLMAIFLIVNPFDSGSKAVLMVELSKQPKKTTAAPAVLSADERAFQDSLAWEEGFNRVPDILAGTFNSGSYRENADKLNLEYEEIVKTWVFIRRYQEKPGDKDRASIMRKWQSLEFPAMREAFANIFATSLWEENIYVSVSGKKKNILTFVGGTYASNKNIKETMDLLNASFNKYRFERVIFKWYKEQRDYTSYSITAIADTDQVYDLSN